MSPSQGIYGGIKAALLDRCYTGYTQKNGAVSKVNKKFISHLTRTQRTQSAAATVQVSHALTAVRFSCATSSSLLMLTAGPVSKMAS